MIRLFLQWLRDRREHRDAEHVFAEEELRARFESARRGLAPDKKLSAPDERRWALIEAGLVTDADLRTVLTDLNARMGERQT